MPMDKNVEKMTLKEFYALKDIDWTSKDLECDSLVLLPTKEKYNESWALYYVVPCLDNKPLGKFGLYDTHSIFTNGEFERIGIDCLAKSGLMRLFLEQNRYVLQTIFHQTITKDNRYKIVFEKNKN